MVSPTRPVLPFHRARPALATLVLLWFAPALVAAPTTAPPQSTSANPTQERSSAVCLEPGKPIEKTLAGGATDSYEIQADAGQFLHAVVEQLGIDVALTFYGPDGKQIASMDSPNGTSGLEQISTIADDSGIYRLEVASGDNSMPAGRYRVTINSPRAPTDQDRARISAERTFFEAVQQQQKGDAISLRVAIQKFEDSLALWRAATDAYEEAMTLDVIGSIHYHFGEKKALECFNQALLLHRAAGDRSGEANSLNSIAVIYNNWGEKQKALEYYNQALPIERQLGDRDSEGAVLNNLGRVYDSLGEKQKALEYYNQALLLRRAAGNRSGEAITLDNIGQVFSALGEKQKALEYYNQELPLERATGERLAEARALNNIGLTYSYLGQKQRALEYYGQALSLERTIGNRNAEASTLQNIGATYTDLGAQQKALEYFDQALPLERALGARSSEAYTLNSIGFICDNLGEKQKALDYYNQALTLERAVGDRTLEAVTLGNMGHVSDESGEADKALEYYTQELILGRAVGNPEIQGQILGVLMRYWRKRNSLPAAIFFGKQSVDAYQQIRKNIQGLDIGLQRSFAESKAGTYRELADLLITQGRLPEAQQMLDLLKNEEYFEFIRRDGREASSLTALVNFTKSEEMLNREYEENASRVTAVGNEWAALHSNPSRTPEEDKHFAELSDRLKTANEAWEKFLIGLNAELGKSKEAQKTVENVQESASAMQRVVRQLGAGAVALYTLFGQEKYRVIVVTPTVMVAREYPIKAEDLREKVFEFRQALVDPNSDPVPPAKELYRILVGPVAGDLEGAKATTLMWSLDDVLRYLPMATLHDGHEYLVEKYRNTVFTPTSVASLTERPNVNGWRGLGMGVSKSYGDFTALPSVPEELRGIIRDKNIKGSSGVIPGQMMLDETFTEATMKKALENNFPIVHIASHFAFAPGNETNSFLLLGGTDPQGEHLSLAEIREDPGFTFADTELLTLSACDTGVGGAAGDGREVDGLGILAQQKGAKAVVATLWAVSDESTGLLMQEFYRLWTTSADMPKAEALRQAQLALLRGELKATRAAAGPNAKTGSSKDQTIDARGVYPIGATAYSSYTHPYYWAPFILIGNWR